MKTIFLHIPKAGGSTFLSILERIYNKETIFDIVVKSENWKEATDEFIKISEIEKEAIGYGYRTPNIRMQPTPEWKQMLSTFFSSMKEYRLTNEEYHVRIIGDTGLVWGWFTERIEEHDGSVRTVRVRISSTWVKNGEDWKLVMYHRDSQYG